ncbi:MAG: SAM-dependent methyltransferase [Pedobacter sp.]|nr:MAG: SAM-dependent methyltransferase [Pedobacter sp.]
MNALKNFLDKTNQLLTAGKLLKVSLSHYKGNIEDLKQCIVKPILIKQKLKLSFTYRYKTKDLFKNYDLGEGVEKIGQYINAGFQAATLFSASNQLNLTLHPKGHYILRDEKQQSQQKKVNQISLLKHDKQKQRDIPENTPFLKALGLTNEKGEVYKIAQDKFKQINHYIKLLKPAITELGSDNINVVADMGSGKGYLTFALYDYLSQLNSNVKVIGIEYRKDLVEFCNQISQSENFNGLNFKQGTIINAELPESDLIIALHACDTATDDAIYKGIKNRSQMIVVAPCCHKQIRKEMEKNKPSEDLKLIIKHGIFLERQAEMLTDAIRVLWLEYFGYKTKALEFISDAHTPKNVMLIALYKKEPSSKTKQEILEKLNNAKKFYGITLHHLEYLLTQNHLI